MQRTLGRFALFYNGQHKFIYHLRKMTRSCLSNSSPLRPFLFLRKWILNFPADRTKDRMISERGEQADLLRGVLINSRTKQEAQSPCFEQASRLCEQQPVLTHGHCHQHRRSHCWGADTEQSRRHAAPFARQSRQRVPCRLPIRHDVNFEILCARTWAKPNVFTDFQSMSETKDPLISV